MAKAYDVKYPSERPETSERLKPKHPHRDRGEVPDDEPQFHDPAPVEDDEPRFCDPESDGPEDSDDSEGEEERA